MHAGVDLVVAEDHVVGALEILVEQHLGCPRDRLDHRGGEAHQLVADLVEFVVEVLRSSSISRTVPVT